MASPGPRPRTKARASLRAEPGSSGTAVSLTVTYERPGGVAGALLAPFVEHTVQHRATVALERLREHLSPA